MGSCLVCSAKDDADPYFLSGQNLQLQYDNLLSLLNILFILMELKLLLFVLQKELEKQRRLEKEQQLQKKARDHYEKVLLRKLGILPWKRLREQAKENLVVSAEGKGNDWRHRRKGRRVDAALSRSLNRLLGQIEMEKAKILPAYLALY